REQAFAPAAAEVGGRPDVAFRRSELTGKAAPEQIVEILGEAIPGPVVAVELKNAQILGATAPPTVVFLVEHVGARGAILITSAQELGVRPCHVGRRDPDAEVSSHLDQWNLADIDHAPIR